MNDTVFGSVVGCCVGLISKIVFDWLKGINKQSQPLPVCSNVFLEINKSLDRGEKRFDRVEQKLDSYHSETQRTLMLQSDRITAVEVRQES